MDLMYGVTEQSIGLVRGALAQQTGEMAKAAGWSQPAGPTAGPVIWDLEVPAKNLFPVMTPLRNKIARRTARGGVQANWKAVTGINTTNLDAGVSDGNRGPVVTTSWADYLAAYRQIGLEDYVTWGAQYAAGSGIAGAPSGDAILDLRARSQTNLLWAVMIAEEFLDLGGNTSVALGQGNRPTVADVGTGGALAANTTYSVIVAPLTLQGYRAATVAGGVRGSVTRTNIDGSTDTYGGGTGQPSTNRTVTTANDGNATHSLTASTAPTTGAFAYAWFWGAAGAEVLGAITTINSVVITAAAAGTQTAASLTSDYSTNGLVYDGLLTQAAKSGSGAYYLAQATGTAGAGTPLTADNVGGVVEIDTMLQAMWDNYRLSDFTLWVNSQEQKNITHKVLSGSSTGAQRFMIQTSQGQAVGGDLVVSYLNKFSLDGSKAMPVRLHPNMPPGTMMLEPNTLPYPLADIDVPVVKRLRQDYFAQEWPVVKRRWEYGCYFDGVLQNYVPFGFGVITNIGNG